jgi:hypothetical protein
MNFLWQQTMLNLYSSCYCFAIQVLLFLASRELTCDLFTVLLTSAKCSVVQIDQSVSFYKTTGHNIPEGSHLYTCCHENPKSHFAKCLVCRACA